jgi:hypothetical protein
MPPLNPGSTPAPPAARPAAGTAPRVVRDVRERAPEPRVRVSRVAFGLLLAAVCVACGAGLPYYILSAGERLRSPLHAWFRPAGYVGQSAGLLAFAIFLFLWLYPLRKKFRWLAFTGSISRWLDVHVLAALGLPLLVAVHAAWRFRGLIGLGFWSLVVVWLSGVVGRYVYARIPRRRTGVELTLGEIVERRQHLLQEIVRQSGLEARVVEATLAVPSTPLAGRGVAATVAAMIADDFARRRAARTLRRHWRAHGRRPRGADARMLTRVTQLARHEMALAQQARMLDASQQVFRYWHVLHRPVAVAALVAVVVHVAVVVALGATWLW